MDTIVIANDNEPDDDYAVVANDLVLPPEIRDMLEQCDRVGIGMDMLMSICRARLHGLGFREAGATEQVLTVFRNAIERHR